MRVLQNNGNISSEKLMSEKPDFEIRWLVAGDKIRQVYDLPRTIPWPMEMPTPGHDDCFLNVAALGAASEFVGGGSPNKKWDQIADFCRLCEEASGAVENFEYERGLEILQEASEIHECAFVHWQRCICHLELHQAEQALAAAYHAASAAPQCAVFWRVFGELCQDRGMPKEAKDAFERAFFGGEQTPSVIAAMRKSGMLVDTPGAEEGVLVSPTVAAAIFATHIAFVSQRKEGATRLIELAEMALDNRSTAHAALGATISLLANFGGGPAVEVMHAEALWANGREKESRAILNRISVEEIPKKRVHKILALSRDASPKLFAKLKEAILSRGGASKDSLREIFGSGDLRGLEHFANEYADAEGLVFLAEELTKAKRRKEAVEAASKANQVANTASVRSDAARVMIENKEYEKACAILSRIPEDKRSGLENFLFGEALWQMGVFDLAGPMFSKAGEDLKEDSVRQNSQMREAQCRGLMIPLDESITLSPTRRLGRSIVVSSQDQEWTSVVAPTGLPSSSYVRIKTDKPLKPGCYRIFEFSRQGGENLLGEIFPQEPHDELALAIEPSGKVYVGAKRAGAWVKSADS